MRIRSSHRAGAGSGEGGSAVLESAPVLPLGKIMRDTGLISDHQLGEIIARQEKTGTLFGQAAVELGYVTEAQIRAAVAEQQNFPLFEAGDSRLDPVLVAAFDPRDQLSEDSRDLRRMLTTRVRPDGEAIRLVVMLSVDAPSEGAIIAGNLAVSFAQANYSTLLVDGNVTEPLLHGMFRTSNRNGVSTMLSRGGPVEPNIQRTVVPNLSLISAGPPVPNAAELFDKVRIMHRLSEAADQYDIVLVDVSDSKPEEAAVLEGADAAIITVRRHYSSTTTFKAIVKHLETQNVLVLGTVFIE